jgi:thioredoxin-related protein
MKPSFKPLLVLFALFLFAQPAHADQVSEGLKRAKAQNKEVVMYFYSQYCPYCDAMDRDVLGDGAVGATLKKEFVYIRVDVDKMPGYGRKYQIRGYPTTVLAESGGRVIAKIPGYIHKNDFWKVLTYLKGKHYRTMGLGDFLQSG